MSESQALLARIASLRQRLEATRSSPLRLEAEGGDTPTRPDSLRSLVHAVAHGGQVAQHLDSFLPTGTSAPSEPALPPLLTARARRILERTRHLLEQLRSLSTCTALQEIGSLPAILHRDVTTMTECALRLLQALPDTASAQLHQCEGIESIVTLATGRVNRLQQLLARQQQDATRIAQLSEFLLQLSAGSRPDRSGINSLAETILEEAFAAMPIRFLDPPTGKPDRTWLARSIACHGLTSAQVMARLLRRDTELRARSTEVLVATLLHDVGMLGLEPTLLAQAGPLDDEGRRAVESHCVLGAEMLRELPSSDWLVEAALRHHERGDGTGYPSGWQEPHLSLLVRRLAVCDVYAALSCSRPHRPARESRTALTDVLLLAEQGLLDQQGAEKLLSLSFYPVGTGVELADGTLGVVVATPAGRRDAQAPARPVVAVLTSARGQALPAPILVDLSQAESQSIVRALTREERLRTFGVHYPEWAL